MLVKFDHQILARYPKSMLNNLNNVLAITSSITSSTAQGGGGSFRIGNL